MGKKRNIQPAPVTSPSRVKVEIKDEIGNYIIFFNYRYYLYKISNICFCKYLGSF